MTRHLVPLLVSVTAALAAQTIEPGWRHAVQELPAGAGSTLVLERGVVWFTGTRLVLHERNVTRDLLAFASNTFASFTVVVDEHHVLFGESSRGGIWLVPLAPTGTPRQLATVPFNYDAVVWRGHALVSAKTGGFSAAPDNDVIAVDLRTGATDPVALVAGASGPLVVDGQDAVLYATASNSFPPPPGGTSVVRWRADQVAGALGPTRLSLQDAVELERGLDSAGDAALDGDGDLFVTDWVNQRVLELSEYGGRGARRSTLAGYAAVAFSAAGLQFAPARARGPSFEPFQPWGGGTLWLHETTFGVRSQLRAVESAAAVTVAGPAGPIGPGRFTLTTVGAAPDGAGILLLGAGHAHGATAVVLPGFEQVLFASDAVLRPLAGFALAFDGRGQATLALQNPGIGQRLALTVQAAFASAQAPVAGAAGPLALTLL
jgi:hypothetical protein